MMLESAQTFCKSKSLLRLRYRAKQFQRLLGCGSERWTCWHWRIQNGTFVRLQWLQECGVDMRVGRGRSLHWYALKWNFGTTLCRQWSKGREFRSVPKDKWLEKLGRHVLSHTIIAHQYRPRKITFITDCEFVQIKRNLIKHGRRHRHWWSISSLSWDFPLASRSLKMVDFFVYYCKFLSGRYSLSADGQPGA